jgi:hypothetical protein
MTHFCWRETAAELTEESATCKGDVRDDRCGGGGVVHRGSKKKPPRNIGWLLAVTATQQYPPLMFQMSRMAVNKRPPTASQGQTQEYGGPSKYMVQLLKPMPLW